MVESMRIDIPPIAAAERTPLVECLLAILDAQHQEMGELKETVQKLRDEIAILKGQKPRPVIAPSRLEATPRKPPPADGEKRAGSQKRCKNTSFITTHDVKIPFPNRPPGSVSRGHEEYVVQELMIQAKVLRYLRERIETAEGGTLLAPLPDDVVPGSHYGPALIAYMLFQHHHCNVTQPLLLEQLREMGIDISAGQVSRILIENHDEFHREKAELLSAGLESSYIGVDDTGARHKGHNGYCTAIGNDLFAYFESTDCKSRLNFLNVLRGMCTAYAINETTLVYWERQQLSRAVTDQLKVGPVHFADDAAWQTRLAELGITTERHIRMATEGALLGQLIEQGVSPKLVILSDGAPQFDILVHASCWVHAERPLARVVPYNEAHREAIEQVRQQLWDLYKDLKAYRQQPLPALKPTLEARFDALVGQKTDYSTSIGSALKEMQMHRADLLRVLERPEVPLHNNGTESIIRGYVKTRKISGSTRNDTGRRCRDTFASLKKTCRKLGVSFWAYLGDRIRGRGTIPHLADLIRQQAAASASAEPALAVPA
jgi:hypothetical protein